MNVNHQMYRISQQDQERAAELHLARRSLARDRPTFVHFIAQLHGHCAAVQIIITPFPLPQFPDHLGFWPQCEYQVCHEEALTEHTDQSIAQVVQNIVSAYFRLGEWDISTKDCVAKTLDPSLQPGEATCPTIAEKLLERYASSAAVSEHSKGTKRTTPVSDKDNRQEGSGQGTTPGSSQTESSRKKRRTATNRNQHGSVHPGNSQVGATYPGAETAIISLVSEPDGDRVSDIVMRIGRGLKAVSTAVSTAPPRILELSGQRLTYERYAAHILSTAKTWGKDNRNSVWWARFLAGSISSAGLSLPARPADLEADIPKQSCSEIARWRNVARFSNTLVKNLYPSWKDKAFLVPHALAARNESLRKISDLGQDRLLQIAEQVVRQIEEEQPEISGEQFLHPASIVGPLLSQSYETTCRALQLPCLEVASEGSEGGLLRIRNAQASHFFNKRFRTIEQQPSHTPSKATIEADDSLRRPTDEEPAARLLYQLQSQRDLTPSHSTPTNTVHQASASTGFPSTSEDKQGPPSLDGPQIIREDFMRDNGIRLGAGGPIQRVAHNEVVNNCSNMSPEASLIRSNNYYADLQNFSQIGDQAPVDSRNKNTMQWQAQVVQKDAGVETTAPKISEAWFNEKAQDVPSHPEQSSILSVQAERLLQNGADPKMADSGGWNIDCDMDVYDGWNIDRDMDVFEGSNINPDIDPNMAGWNIDLDMDLFTNNQKRDEELLPTSPAHAT